MTLRLKPFLALFALLFLPVLGLTATPARADLIKQAATYTRTVLMTATADHITGATGLTLTIKAAKAGGTPATITDTVTEQGSGRYAIALTTTDTNTLGALDLTITATGADPSDTHDQVIAFDPNDASLLGLTGVATATTQTAQGTTLGTINTQATGANTQATGANTQASTLLLSLATYQSALTTGSTTTALNTALTGTADLTGGKVVFTAGVNKGVARTIAAMNSTTGVITLLTGVPNTPGATDAFSVVQGSKALEQFLAGLGTDSRPVLSANAQPNIGITNALPALDGSNRVLLQPVQTGVTIPTVTALTNPVVASSVTGAVGSVTAPVVASSVTGAVGSVTGAVGSVTASVVASSVTAPVVASSVTGAVASVTAPVTVTGTVALSGADETKVASIGSDTSGTTSLLTRIPGTVQPQTGDAFARLGAPSGVSVDADILTRSTFAGGAVASVTAPVVASSVTGAVGSVTAPVVASSVTGSVGSISGITFPSNFGTFSVDTSGRVTLVPGQSTVASNFAAAPTAAQNATAVAAAVLVTPANLLATDASGKVAFNNASIGAVTGSVGSVTGGVTVATNNDKTGYSGTATNMVAAAPTPAQIASVILLTPANLLATNASNQVTTANPATAGSGVTEATIWAYTNRALTDKANFSGTATNFVAAPTAAQNAAAITFPATVAVNNFPATVALSSGDEILLGHADVATSTRSTFAGGAVASVTGAVGSVTGSVTAGNLPADYLSSAEQTSLSGASANTSALVARALPPTAAQIQAYMDANSALPGLVWSVGTRTVTGGTIGTYTGNTPQTGDAYLRLASAVVLPTTAPAGYGGGASGDTSGVTTLLTRIPASLSDAGIQADVIASLVAQGYTVTRSAKLDNLDATLSGVPARLFAYTLGGVTFGDHTLNTSAVTWGNSTPTYSGLTQTSPFAIGSTPYVTSTITKNSAGQITTRTGTLTNQ